MGVTRCFYQLMSLKRTLRSAANDNELRPSTSAHSFLSDEFSVCWCYKDKWVCGEKETKYLPWQIADSD